MVNLKKTLLSLRNRPKEQSQPQFAGDYGLPVIPNSPQALFNAPLPSFPEDIRHPLELEGSPVNMATFRPQSRIQQDRIWFTPQQQAELNLTHRAKKESRRFAEEEQQREIKLRQEEAECKRQEKRKAASPESIRNVRDLIREKYRLDLYVWSRRNIQVADRNLVQNDCMTADSLLEQICCHINGWDESSFGTEEWKVVAKIQENIRRNENRHVLWMSQLPWDPAWNEDDLQDEEQGY